MRLHRCLVCAVSLGLAAPPVGAQGLTLGGDRYVGGDAAGRIGADARDVFAAGSAVRLTGDVDQDAHLAGFSVEQQAAIRGNLYAAGGSVHLDAPVGGDLTAFGFAVDLGPQAAVQGNTRLAGGSLRIAAPVQGTLLASGSSVTLDGTVTGDAWIMTEDMTFGPEARIAGTLHLTAPADVTVPDRVAAADRVVLRELDMGQAMQPAPDWARDWMRHPGRDWRMPGLLNLSVAVLLVLGFLLALAAIFLGAAPVLVEDLRARAATRPWRSMLWGVAGLSALVGLIPVAAATLIGLPLVPIALLALILFWTLGYLLGLYVVAMAILTGLRPAPPTQGLGMRLLALALGLLLAALLNFVPLLGWMANLLLGFLGLGAVARALAARLSRPVP